MFIRLKKVKKRSGKEYEYAHLVRGVWKKRKKVVTSERVFIKNFNNSVHRYSKMLGRAYRFEKIRDLDFSAFLGTDFENFTENNSVEEIYKKLLEYELVCRGFKKINGVYNCGRIYVDLGRLIIHDGKRDVVLKLNERGGYLCSLNLNDLFNIKSVNGRYEGIHLMKKLKMCGVNMGADNFYFLVNSLLKKN